MVPPWLAATAAPSGSTSASGAKSRPGLVQNWPTPMVSDCANAVAISSGRAAAASGSTTAGFTLPSSP